MKCLWVLGAVWGLTAFGHVAIYPVTSPVCKELVQRLGYPYSNRFSLDLVIETPRLVLFRQRYDDAVSVADRAKPSLSLGRLYLFPEDEPGVATMPISITGPNSIGIGTEAKFALLRYAFEVAGYQKIQGTISHSNTASRRLHEKLGFQCVSQDEDILTYSLTADQFARVKESFGEEELEDFNKKQDSNSTK